MAIINYFSCCFANLRKWKIKVYRIGFRFKHKRLYKKLEIKFNNFKSDFEADIGSEELKKDVFNELRMEELDQNNQSKDE